MIQADYRYTQCHLNLQIDEFNLKIFIKQDDTVLVISFRYQRQFYRKNIPYSMHSRNFLNTNFNIEYQHTRVKNKITSIIRRQSGTDMMRQEAGQIPGAPSKNGKTRLQRRHAKSIEVIFKNIFKTQNHFLYVMAQKWLKFSNFRSKLLKFFPNRSTALFETK